MKIQIRQRKEGIDDTELNVEDVLFVHFKNEDPAIDLNLWFEEDGKEVLIQNRLSNGAIEMRPSTNEWKAKLISRR